LAPDKSNGIAAIAITGAISFDGFEFDSLAAGLLSGIFTGFFDMTHFIDHFGL